MATPSSIVDHDRYQYDRVRVRDKTGKVRHSANNGDAVARAMTGLTTDEVRRVAKANGLKLAATGNPGTQRMSLGQSLRAIVRRGEAVTIGSHVVKSLTQRVAVPEVEAEKPKRKRGGRAKQK